MDEDGFVRQRRNIIVVSLLLLFADAYGLALSQELNLLGTKALMTKPFPVAPILWLVWAYLVLRYWQAFREQGERTFSATYREHMANYLYRLALPLARAHVQVSPPQRVEFPGEANPGIMAAQYLTTRIAKATVGVMYNVHVNAGTVVGFTQHTQDESFGFFRVIWARIRAVLHVTFNTSVFTERYLPFVFALAPVVHASWKYWVA